MVWLELDPDSHSAERTKLAELAQQLVNKDKLVSSSTGPQCHPRT